MTQRSQSLLTLSLALGACLLLGCAAPLASMELASPTPPIPRVGFLGASNAASWHQAFHDSMRQLGYVNGQNVMIETRYAAQQPGALDRLAEELVTLPVDAIVTADFASATAVLRQTRTIPIVLANSGSPLPPDLSSELSRPGSNLTGIGASPTELGAKRLEIAMAAFPGLRRVGILYFADGSSRRTDLESLRATIRDQGLQLHDLPYGSSQDFEPALAAAREHHTDVVLVMGDQIFAGSYGLLLQSATTYGVKLLFERSELVGFGALIAYGPSFRESYARTAVYVDRLLRGAGPSDLPVEEPPAAQLGVNLRTAEALGVSIPLPVVLQADVVVN